MADKPAEEKTLHQRVAEVIDSIRPYIQSDGGDIELVGVEDGIAKVRLMGACVGCPMSAMTLKAGVEQRVRSLVPEIKSVENVD
ncbi:MAG: NifU family protein [Planctomycetota bacterium]